MNLQSESDEHLMGQVQRGNREALEKLVRRHASPLLTFIVRMTGDRHKSEDIFQDVFLAVWKKRKQYKIAKTFRSWLYTIAANKCRDDYRRSTHRPKPTDQTDTEVDHQQTPVQMAIATETSTLVADVIADLPVQQRTTIVLRIWNQLTYREIADLMSVSEGTARSNMHRALEAMRHKISAQI